MGMSIVEAIRHLDTYSSTMGSGQTTQAQHEDAKRVAISTMRKYQKIEQIVKTWDDDENAMILADKIREVIDDSMMQISREQGRYL